MFHTPPWLPERICRQRLEPRGRHPRQFPLRGLREPERGGGSPLLLLLQLLLLLLLLLSVLLQQRRRRLGNLQTVDKRKFFIALSGKVVSLFSFVPAVGPSGAATETGSGGAGDWRKASRSSRKQFLTFRRLINCLLVLRSN